MSLAFDSLAYMKALEAGGTPREVAETHTAAIRDHVMRELVTRSDLQAALERQTLRLTVAFGSMLLATSAVLIGAFALLVP